MQSTQTQFKEKISHFRVIEHTTRCQSIRERPGAVKAGHENELRLAVKQYIPIDNPYPKHGDVTIIGAHGIALPKELYEPLWDDIYEALRKRNRRIRSIWIADIAHQGQSGILNESILGDDPGWFDHGRDLLSMINQFQEQFLPPLVGIGHSAGGLQLVYLSLMHPSLFQGLILLDPVIDRGNPCLKYAQMSTCRRDWWPSRRHAAEKFKKSPLYGTWNPRVFDKWIQYGLRDFPLPDGTGPPAVTLTTTKAQEVFSYVRPSYIDQRSGLPRGVPEDEIHPDDHDGSPFYRPEPSLILRRLPDMRPAVLYIFGANSDIESPASRRRKLEITGTGVGGSGGITRGLVEGVSLPCGHMVPLELVPESAEASASFIDAKLGSWETRTSRFQKNWERVPHHERVSVDKQWAEHMRSLPRVSRI